MAPTDRESSSRSSGCRVAGVPARANVQSKTRGVNLPWVSGLRSQHSNIQKNVYADYQVLVNFDAKIKRLSLCHPKCLTYKMTHTQKKRVLHKIYMVDFLSTFLPFCPIHYLFFLVFILEEFRKKQKKSNMSDNLQYFMETSYKATGSDTLKVKIISHTC